MCQIDSWQPHNRIEKQQKWLTYVTTGESGPWGFIGKFAECTRRRGQQRLGLGSITSPSQSVRMWPASHYSSISFCQASTNVLKYVTWKPFSQMKPTGDSYLVNLLCCCCHCLKTGNSAWAFIIQRLNPWQTQRYLNVSATEKYNKGSN